MPERTSYAEGTPSWVDLSTPDPAGAKGFYRELFGWEATDPGPVEETGGYSMFTKDGKLVAGVGPIQGDAPPAWATYFAVDDADATAARATDAGAQVLFGPMDVMDAGRMAVFMHPATGAFGIWQAGRHTGAQLVNEPGGLTWNELLSRDVDGAKQVLTAIFGLGYDDNDMGGMTYSMLTVDDQRVAGLMAMPGDVPAEVPSFWQVYLGVADCDAAVARATELGGEVAMPAMTAPGVGRFAALKDPAGAMFSVIQGEG